MFVAIHLLSIMLKQLDSISSPPLSCNNMKVARIFISLDRCSDFASLLPDGKLGPSGGVQELHNDGTKIHFCSAQVAALLHVVKQVNGDPAVFLLLRNVGEVFAPGFEGGPGLFQVGGKISRTIPRPRHPGSRHSRGETGAVDPIVLETKNLGVWNRGRNLDLERDMIRSGSGEGGENGVGEKFIPGHVNEDAI